MENLNVSYRHFHETYLSDLKGTSHWDVLFLLITIVVVGFLALYLRCLVKYNRPILCFTQDIVTFVIPAILLMTVYNKYTLHCACILVPCTTFIVVYEVFVRPSNLPAPKILNSKITWKHSPFITHFKAIVSLLSIICILAVDFTVFPLKYAKTESYGYSLMDTGVAFFIVSNGLVVNFKRINNAIEKSFTSNLPIVLLGIIRFATTEKIGYQKHFTEYGLHWNFFFTLAIVKFVGSLVMTGVSGRVGLVGLGVLVGHQFLLSYGVEAWVMGDAPRTTFLSANREGIASLPGYISLYLLSTAVGQVLIFGRTSPTVGGRIRLGLKCMSISIVLLVTMQLLTDVIPPASRRLANSTFIAWMSGLCLLLIGLSMVYEVIIILIFRRRHVTNREEERSISVLEAISANNLLFFLMCNLLTGAVNLSIQTLLVPPLHSLLVITSYTVFSCAVISVIYFKKWKLKFW